VRLLIFQRLVGDFRGRAGRRSVKSRDVETHALSGDGVNGDVQLALAPESTFDRLVRARQTGSAAALTGRLLLTIAVMGVSVAIDATGRASLELAASIGASWSFVLLVQALAAAAVILPARARAVTGPRAFELWFQAHLPWSLWLLLPAIAALVIGHKVGDTTLAGLALIPLGWSALLLRAFARHVLRARRALLVVAVHQAVLWGLALCYITYAVGGWDRMLAEIGL
jgi:hypothetical protein